MSNSKEITMPDFDQWAVGLWCNHGPRCTDVKEALKQAFDQGRALGQREGRELAEKEWYLEQDKALEEWANETEEEEQELWETASCIDYLKWEEEYPQTPKQACDQGNFIKLNSIERDYEKEGSVKLSTDECEPWRDNNMYPSDFKPSQLGLYRILYPTGAIETMRWNGRFWEKPETD